jgi:transcriptional regulator of acetoin/glycerol metabolism
MGSLWVAAAGSWSGWWSGVAHEVGNPLNFACGGSDELASQLDACHGNQSQAARLLEMPRRTLVERLRAYGVTRKPRR